MEVNWSMAGFILAFSVFVAPHSIRGVRDAIQAVRIRSRRCVRFKWEDVSDGLVNHAESLSSFRVHSHRRSKECWNSASSLAGTFDQAWKISAGNPTYVENIPETLPVGQKFICTDALTVLAFVLCTVDEDAPGTWSSRDFSFGETKVELETLGKVTVAHIQGTHRLSKRFLTKTEITRMLSGWPPWYREIITTRDRAPVEFPIRSESDIPRAGWILAVGLMDLSLKTQEPLGLYRCPNEPQYPGFRRNGVVFRQAIARCRDHIRKNILPAFPREQLILNTLNALTHLVVELTDSGMPHTSLDTANAPPLRSSECQFIFEHFNSYAPLSASDIAKLGPILLPTMVSAVSGAVRVVKYLKSEGQELIIPPELRPFDREIWLRDCG